MLLEELRKDGPGPGFAAWSGLTALESVDLYGVLGPDPVASLSPSDCCALTAPTGLTPPEPGLLGAHRQTTNSHV